MVLSDFLNSLLFIGKNEKMDGWRIIYNFFDTETEGLQQKQPTGIFRAEFFHVEIVEIRTELNLLNRNTPIYRYRLKISTLCRFQSYRSFLLRLI